MRKRMSKLVEFGLAENGKTVAGSRPKNFDQTRFMRMMTLLDAQGEIILNHAATAKWIPPFLTLGLERPTNACAATQSQK